VIGPRLAGEQGFHGRQEVVGDGAADATVRQFYHVFIWARINSATFQQVAIDADIAEFVDDQGDAPALVVFGHKNSST